MSALRTFLDACKSGSYNKVRRLVESGVDINTKGDEDRNGLHLAAWQGHENITRLLIEAGIDINAKEMYGSDALHFAAWQGFMDIIVILIEAGIDINTQDEWGYNGLHIVVEEDYEDIVPILIEAGIDINAKDDNDDNALDICVRRFLSHTHVFYNGYKSIAHLLVDAGCALSEEHLQCNIVHNALTANADRREGAKNAMAEIDFPRRAAGSMLHSEFHQIRNSILSFIFLSPRES